MERIYIRRYKKNPDFWEVVGGGKIIRTMSKSKAKQIADARRRIKMKHALRRKGISIPNNISTTKLKNLYDYHCRR